MSKLPSQASLCVGSPSFNPEKRIEDEEALKEALELLLKDDFQGAIRSWFEIPDSDQYVYHAMTSVKLAQVQEVVRLGRANGLHDWYWDDEGEPLPPPPQADIASYISIFLSSTSTPAALKSFSSNAKKDSLRARSAAHLLAKRFILPSHPLAALLSAIPKAKRPPSPDPYLDFWAWACRNLEWCGPVAVPAVDTTNSTPSLGIRRALHPRGHHVLPVLMHHFGCAAPSHEALSALKMLAAGRAVADVGSGNGYWSFMLRRYGVPVVPVDSAQSEWRVMWVRDTVEADGVRWLSGAGAGAGAGRGSAAGAPAGGKDMVLLMVYPIVGGGVAGGVEGGFTRGLVEAYRGDTIAVVGTQNQNGYTGFRNLTVDEYMEREQKEWTKVIQIALPSFPGKDEALYVFQKGEALL